MNMMPTERSPSPSPSPSPPPQPHRKRSRSADREARLQQDLETALHEKRVVVQQLTEARAHLRHARLANEQLEMDFEAADERIRDLEVSLMDARESNEQHAEARQQLQVRCTRAEGAAAALQGELLERIMGHATEMVRLMDHHRKEVDQARREALNGVMPTCPLCCDTDRGEFVVLGCCHQVVCGRCRSRLRSCPYCRERLFEDYDALFEAWWGNSMPAQGSADLC